MNLVFLIGFMGCGKTHWGKKVAAALNYEFIDLDHKLEEQTGITIADYFAAHGEDSFRKLESDILKQTPYPQDAIVSTGGGLPCFFDNIEWMNAHGKTLYIKLPPKALAYRLENAKTPRPALQGKKGDELLALIEQKLAEREDFYQKAKYVIDGIDLSIERFAEILRIKV
jgi:shikimate kinase